jgi:CRISPR/Cas system-associated exonuclease Cas4 (RecB family)
VSPLDAGPKINVTDVTEHYFCMRKGALVAHYVPTDQSSPVMALGTIEHAFRHRIMQKSRERYASLVRDEDVARFANGELLEIILEASQSVQNMARTTQALYADEISNVLRAHTDGAMLDEELNRANEYRSLLGSGVTPTDALDSVLPRFIERGLGSMRLGLKGRVDQVWVRRNGRVPVDLKTHGPDLRKFFGESHWIQAALYGLLLEEEGASVPEVGLHYTYVGRPEYRPFDEELKARAMVALREARKAIAGGGIPPAPPQEDKCRICLHRSRCFGEAPTPARPAEEASPARRLHVVSTAPAETAAQAVFVEFHRGLSRVFHRPRLSRADVDEWTRSQRHALLAKYGTSAETKIAVRRLLKTLEKLVEKRLADKGAVSHAMYFEGNRVESTGKAGCFYVVGTEETTPWVYVDSAAKESDREIADHCFRATRDTGLACTHAIRVHEDGHLSTFDFGESERQRWGSRLVSSVRLSDHDESSPASEPSAPSREPPKKEPPATCPEPLYVGALTEDRTKPLKFGRRGDQIFGFVREEHRDAFAKDDYVVAEQSSAQQSGPKRVFLRVLEIVSAPLSAVIRVKSVNELDTQVLLEPLWECTVEDPTPKPVANDDLNGYKIRRATADEVRGFLYLPETGLPLGRLSATGEPVTVNFPFAPDDALFRSFFVVGAKGKGKTSFVREISTLATSYLPGRDGDRPAVVILDGEPNANGETSEFGGRTFGNAHAALCEQLGDSLLEHPQVREIRLTRAQSGLAFSYGDIKVEDIPLLLPPMTETSANVLRRVLAHMARDKSLRLRSLQEALEHLRHEVGTNAQVDGRTARAIAERLMSPQVEVLERNAPDAVPITDLLQPGTISVVNVVDLDDDQRKVIGLYLLLAFEKLAEQRGGVNTLLVLDEGEKLFPRRRGGNATPTAVDRLATKVAGIARRGRRRRFGMVVCTQTPSDVHREIVANCDVKLTFNVSGEDSWVRENLGADLVQGVKSLTTGECYVDLRKVAHVTKPMRTRLFRT